jgi:hypothetical protein
MEDQNVSDDNHEIMPASTGAENVLDIAATVSSLVPWIGGPLSVVLSGMSLSRKLNRVREVLTEMAEKIQGLESEASKKYVETDEFQELLEKTLRQSADERSEEKRKVYAAFLAGAIQSPGEPYDEQVRFLRTLEQLQPDHIRMLNALMQSPDPDPHAYTSSISATLQRRLPEMSADRIRDLAAQLTDMRLADLGSLNTMMTPRGAAELRPRVTDYGRRFTAYIQG